MKSKRNEKLLAILALCVAVVGLTLGFAAFSNSLTISSSATVTPDASDFKLKMYGLPQNYNHNELNIYESDIVPLSLYTSTTTAGATLDSALGAELATIDNDTLTLKGIKAKFESPDEIVNYVVVLKNEGKYDAYGNMFNISLPSHTCTPGEGTTKGLVDATCESITLTPYLGYLDESSSTVDWATQNHLIDDKGNIKIGVGEHAYLRIQIRYDGTARADGPFDVKWDDFNFNFTSAVPA